MPRKKDLELKAPPQSLDSEQALIAACLIRPEIIPGIMAVLQPDDFYKIAHQHIVSALFELKQNSDIVLVWTWLVKHKFDQETDKDYLMSVAASSSTSAGWKYYADVIKEKAQRRQILNLCTVSAEQVFGEAEYPLEEIMSGLKGGVRDIQRDNTSDQKSNLQIIQAVFKDIELRSERQDYFVGIKTGFDPIDNNLAGLEPGTTIYLAARPSMGKTALAVNIATNVSFEYPDQKVLYFNLESTAVALVRRQIALQSGIHYSRIRRGQIGSNEWENLTQTVGRLSDNSALSILDHPKFRYIENIISHSESTAMDHKIGLIVIDHIQKMNTRERKQNRHLELSHISNEIQDLAKNLNVPIIVLCQLNRVLEGQSNKKPQLQHLRESGDLEQNADCVWGLYRKDKDATEAEIEQLKGRDTGIFSVTLFFDPKIQRFSNPIQDYSDQQESWVK